MLRGRYGAAKLAAASGVPVIPIGMWGTERVWPRSSKVPDVTNLLKPPTVTIEVGAPVEGLTGDLDTDTALIMAAITALLPPEAHEHREPSSEELARTYPGGIVPDDAAESANHETDRRPGTD
jgi:putative phosphoserine phosphatase/1-acylglycerol-3-phosphate O-acyltransferase